MDIYDCIENLEEPDDEDSFAYDLLKTLYDLNVELCKTQFNQTLEFDYKSASTAARKLVNSEKKSNSIEESEIMFNIFINEAILKENEENDYER